MAQRYPVLRSSASTARVARLRPEPCSCVSVQVAGPVSEGPAHLQFNSSGDVRVASQCFNFNYTGFDLTFVSP
jgi:hypothetical protein